MLGLLAACLGRPRTAPLDDLAALDFGVRVDRAGRLLVDFRTVLGVLTARGRLREEPVLVRAHYLAGAVFLAGLGGPEGVLRRLEEALRRPAPTARLYLGRACCPPGAPLYLPDGLKDLPLKAALLDYPPPGRANPPAPDPAGPRRRTGRRPRAPGLDGPVPLRPAGPGRAGGCAGRPGLRLPAGNRTGAGAKWALSLASIPPTRR